MYSGRGFKNLIILIQQDFFILVKLNIGLWKHKMGGKPKSKNVGHLGWLTKNIVQLTLFKMLRNNSAEMDNANSQYK